MATSVTEVVVGATRSDLYVTVVNEQAEVVNLTGGSVRLQGKSRDLPGVDLDIAGVLHDPGNGVAKWASIGTAITTVQLGALESATYNLRVKFTDASAKVIWGPLFQIKFMPPPV